MGLGNSRDACIGVLDKDLLVESNLRGLTIRASARWYSYLWVGAVLRDGMLWTGNVRGIYDIWYFRPLGHFSLDLLGHKELRSTKVS